MTAMSARQKILDGLAIGASTLCLIHCLLLPLIILMLPALAAFLTLPERFHLAVLLFAVPTSALALSVGYRRHRKLRPIAIVIPGLVLLALGVLAAPTEAWETALTVPGSLLLALGHALNWRNLRHRDRARPCPERAEAPAHGD